MGNTNIIYIFHMRFTTVESREISAPKYQVVRCGVNRGTANCTKPKEAPPNARII